MAQHLYAKETICELAFIRTGQRNNRSWKAPSYAKLTSSHLGSAIDAMNKHQSTKIQDRHDELFAQKNLDHRRTIKWGVDLESLAIDVYNHKTVHVVKGSGMWMFHKNIRCPWPYGLVFTDPDAACAVGIIKLKCDFSRRDVDIDAE